MIRPRHTLLSVVRDLEKGLNDGTVYLNDKDLSEAGYEVHDIHGFLKYWRVGERLLAAVVAVTATLGFLPFLYRRYDSITDSATNMFKPSAFVIWLQAVAYGVLLWIVVRALFSGIKRLIKKRDK